SFSYSDYATTQNYTLSLHDALPIYAILGRCWPNKQINKMFAFLVNQSCYRMVIEVIKAAANQRKTLAGKVCHGSREIEFCIQPRSEEHTSELQSRFDLVCRLLLEKK